MRDVAELCGVSIMTVSRVLHDDPRITQDTKAKVRAAVRQLGYLRNDTARNLRIGRGAGAVGLVISNLANPFYSQLALGVGEVAEQHGLTVMLVNTAGDADREERLIADLMSRRVEGIIISPAGDDHRHLAASRCTVPPWCSWLGHQRELSQIVCSLATSPGREKPLADWSNGGIRG